ncbi:LTA synthase family protein [Haloimpatiens lingqiaonensis]|uniref:LTA synthase family protein n=1 Tax=Haloimpatiens lingqiaonensis TaxID=1380675 RepID=UPI001FAAB5CD|nr:LTA synthase family protein [Haloimpatiens lingqiaonensis]
MQTNLNYSVKKSLRVYLQNSMKQLKGDIFFQYVLIALMLKGLFFICIVPSVNASKIDIIHAFMSVPPIILQGAFIAMFLSISFLFKGRGHIWSLIVLDIIITILFIADIWYYRGYSSYLSPHLLKQFTNLDNLGSSVLSMFHTIDLVFIIDIVFFIFLAIRNKNLYKGVERNVLLFIFVLVISIGYVVYDHYKVDVYGRGFENQRIWKGSWSPNQTLSNLGPIGYHINDIFVYFDECKQYVLSESEKKEIKQWYDEKQENLPDNKYKGIFKGKNLIVLQVESLETFMIGKKINGQEITPNINKLLKESMYFPNVHEQVWNGTSSDCDLMINTSVSPVRSGSTFFRYPGNKYNSLPNLLENRGYSTLAIHPDKGAYWNWMQALYSIGFNKCIDEASFKGDEFIGLGISDGTYLKQVVPMISKQKKPFYTFMVTLTSHCPFELPSNLKELNLEKRFEGTKLGASFQAFHYTDKHIGLFLENIDKEIGLDNTVVVITGDHTGVHKFYQDEISKIKPSELWWAEKNMKVPLIIYSKGSKGQVININGGQLDIMPTVAYLMGIEEKEFSHTAMGRILVKTNRNYTFLATRKFIGKGTKEEEEHTLKTIDLGDKLIRSNYFDKK